MTDHHCHPLRRCRDVRAALLAGREIALLDVREGDPHARVHPLFAANLPTAASSSTRRRGCRGATCPSSCSTTAQA